MPEQDGLNSEQLEFERALRSLSPASARLDPIAAAFEAGRKVRQRQVRALGSAVVVMFLCAAASLVWMRRSMSDSTENLDGASASMRAQTQPSNPPQNAMLSHERVSVVSYVSGRQSPVAPAPQSHTPIQERTMFLPPQPMPSLLILQNAVEKQGLDGLPTTYLPDAEQTNLKNEL